MKTGSSFIEIQGLPIVYRAVSQDSQIQVGYYGTLTQILHQQGRILEVPILPYYQSNPLPLRKEKRDVLCQGLNKGSHSVDRECSCRGEGNDGDTPNELPVFLVEDK